MMKTKRKTSGQASQAHIVSLKQLSYMSLSQLDEMYRAGSLPEISDLDGHPRGCMLAGAGPLETDGLRSVVRPWAASSSFPWAGKSFASLDSANGSGINRVRLFGNHNWFPFKTRVEPSVLDGRPCIFLDYEQPENPAMIRGIHDELRQVSPGLFLGPAMAKIGATPRLVLWFAIDHNG